MGDQNDELEMELDETALQELYTWIDEIPLTRPKKNISRDFSDGVLVAEIVNHFVPKLVDMHNYAAANGNQAKMDNWNLLMRKVFSKMNFQIQPTMIKGIIASKPGVIEIFLHQLRQKIEHFQAKKKAAALREKNHVYDEFGRELGSQTGDYFQENYQFADGSPYRTQNEKAGAYPDYNYGNFQNGQAIYPPASNAAAQQGPYYYQSEPRAIPENRQYPPYAGEVSKPARQLIDQSPRSDQNGKIKPSENRMQRAQSLQDGNDVASLKMALEEKEQALLSSQETVQILHVKVRRLEHLLHLKNLRIDDLNSKLNSPQQLSPQNQLPPQNYPPANLPPTSYAPVPPLKQHPPLPGIFPKAGGVRHHR